MEANSEDIIPAQHTGAKTDIQAEVETSTLAEAERLFEESKARLLDVNQWHKLCGLVTATFKLADEHGNEVQRTAQVGDHFKIDIPGPGTVTGDGYDWARIEAIDDITGKGSKCVAIKVRPATNPTNNKTDVAHFFSQEATSSFMVEMDGNKVLASVHGRNEKPNTDTEAVVDKTRNTMVAAGARLGMSEAQWSSLTKGLVGK